MAAIQDIQNLIAQAKPIPADLQKAALLEAQQQGLDNQALASVFGVPVSMISAAYEATGVTPAPAPAVESAAIERLTQNQPAPAALSPAPAPAPAPAISLPDAVYNIPAPSLPDYRYNDTSGSTGGLSSSTSGSLTNYVTAVEPARSGPADYTGPEMVVTPGDSLGPGEFSLGNATLDRGIGGGGSFVDGNSSTFVQDLIDQDAREEARDVDFLDYLARLAAQEANKPLGGTQGAYDAILDASAAIDTGGEYADALYRLNSDIDNKTKEGFGYAKQAAYGVDSLGNELTPAQIAAAERAATAALDTKNTLVDERNALFEGGVEAGIIETPGFLESLKDTGLEGLSDVLGAGTRGIYNAASNIPVVGGYLGDSIEGLADFFKETKGTLTVNPITGQVQGTWGEIPPWMEKQTVTQIGPIPNSQTTAGVVSGTIFDDFISIGRGEQDIGDVLENRTGQVASTIGIDPKILAAATAAGKTVKDYLEDKAKETALAPKTEDETEAEVKSVAVDLSGGPDIVEEVLGPQGVETVTGEEAIDSTSTNQTLTVGDGADAVDTLLGSDKLEDTGAGGYEEVVGSRTAVDGFDAGSGPDEKVVTDDKVNAGSKWVNQGAGGFDEVISKRVVGDVFDAGSGPDDEVVGPRIIGDPFTFTPILDEEEPPEPPPEVPVLDEEPPEPPPEVPATPTVTRVPLTRTIRREPGDLVDIEYLYNISDPSIFAPTLRGDEDADKNRPYIYSGFADGGIVKEYDLEQLLKKIRG